MSPAPSVSLEAYLASEWDFAFGVDDEDRDAVAATINRWAHAGRWLDLGCGPLLTVWPLFCLGACDLTGLDRDGEVVHFLRMLGRGAIATPAPLSEAMNFAQANYPRLDGASPGQWNPITEVIAGSVLADQPKWRGRFDTVVQIGCFGCLENEDDLLTAFRLAGSYLRPGGIMISATWIAAHPDAESLRWGGRGFAGLCGAQLRRCMEATGLAVLEADVAVVGQEAEQQERCIFTLQKHAGVDCQYRN